ncbi:MAG: hypothetical protein ACRC6U_04020, partial [Fusobacteriaceae bacterium]
MQEKEILEFLENFVNDFYEGIENDFSNYMKKQKVTKLSVGKYNIDGADYLDNSKSPIIETIKKTDSGIKIYYQNKNVAPSAYNVDEIFHTFSLAELADTVLKRTKYIKMLTDFYAKTEDIFKDILKMNELSTLEINDEELEILAIHSDGEKYSLVQGIVKEISLKDDRVFFMIEDENKIKNYAHLIGVDAGDLALMLKELV